MNLVLFSFGSFMLSFLAQIKKSLLNITTTTLQYICKLKMWAYIIF